LNVPDDADGHPRYAMASGGMYTHRFKVINRAGTYWYHPHPDMRTGFQANRGLAGLILVHDDEEAGIDLPRGACDVPLVIQDKRFNSSNQIMHSTGSQVGYLGDRILVNGILDFRYPCGSRLYRFRLLNGSNSRIYKLAWSDGQPMFVIGTTGGLLRETVAKPYVMLGPGERLEVIADFRSKQPGSSVNLMSLPFSNGGPGSGTPPQGTQLTICACDIVYQLPESLEIPTTLTQFDLYDRNQAVNANNSRVFASKYMDGMWTINGRIFEMTGVAEEEKVRNGELELWEFRNDLPADQEQPHPMHIHGAQFQIVSRRTNIEEPWYDEIREGYVDEGWHDTALLFPGERVELLLKHGPYPGLFLLHCHNLEHEDMGMMRNILIQP
jgi:FtsP/CotA-like multicopper oxidase with cupredoxin domain